MAYKCLFERLVGDGGGVQAVRAECVARSCRWGVQSICWNSVRRRREMSEWPEPCGRDSATERS